MISLVTTPIALALILSGVLVGRLVARRLPEGQLHEGSKDTVHLTTALVTTMAALLLSLQLSSAKNAFDARQTDLTRIGSEIVLLDRALVAVGPGASRAREALRDTVRALIAEAWPDEENLPASSVVPGGFKLFDAIAAIPAATEAQRLLKNTAVQLSIDLGKMIRFSSEERASTTLLPLFAVEILWLTFIFFGLSVLAPRSPQALTAVILCAIAVSTALFLIIELSTPLSGFIRISSAPLRDALHQISP